MRARRPSFKLLWTKDCLKTWAARKAKNSWQPAVPSPAAAREPVSGRLLGKKGKKNLRAREKPGGPGGRRGGRRRGCPRARDSPKSAKQRLQNAQSNFGSGACSGASVWRWNLGGRKCRLSWKGFFGAVSATFQGFWFAFRILLFFVLNLPFKFLAPKFALEIFLVFLLNIQSKPENPNLLWEFFAFFS